ncbi:Tyrosine-protein kinase Wzc [Roseibacterium elongatum DSM 19469]|uniref:Tyrosine-protein kinase Wzc n=1 Tax=Roseicyclus elongatus DSM 19469 TaxID=1294273 RepID=W8SSG6_9RHOB|nr:Tyrosine-protein kinase Wzc [Roseibacterium elongatum DSM 19469]
MPQVIRSPLRALTFRRLLRGGRPNDAGRLPRYAGFFLLGAAAIWAPLTGYLQTAPLRYSSEMSLILPGAGASASVNLSEIGQASSYADSPYASSAISPTVTYQRLIGADRILDSAAERLGIARRSFWAPRVELIDQTGMIQIRITGVSPEDAQARGDALLDAFFAEIDALREDELTVRETGGVGAIEDYRASVAATRVQIETLQRETGLISAAQYDELVSETNALARRLATQRTALQEQTEAVRALESALDVTPQIAAATLRLHADSEFAALIEEMSAQAAALAEAESRFGPNHPVVLDARAGHGATRDMARLRAATVTGLADAHVAQLDLAPIGGRAALLADLVELSSLRQGLAAEVASLEERLAADEARIAALLTPAAQLEDLQRDFQVAEAVFASAMARAETTKSDRYASYPLVQVLENPSLPQGPSSPRTKLAMAAGIAATMMLLFGLLLGWLRRPLIDKLIVRAEPE